MRRRFNSDVFVQSRWFHVEGEYYPGYNGTYYDPPEPPEANIMKIVQFFDDSEEPWENDDMFIDEEPDIWLFVEKYDLDFQEAIIQDLEGVEW